eukprot:CAMPEP_0198249348 /NCGR_PEP_ID=MMETSP1447-20131203/906_1 /TAXON_ID=420782 /ORGANISM="Chaetoceros dichaeta, Strain CCMP1751" /LENGTH=120 /DNA_ID=CAMNT_0043933961 /DNA_START=188 /DNA_END=550 /DNA_ORIENTATION=-
MRNYDYPSQTPVAIDINHVVLHHHLSKYHPTFHPIITILINTIPPERPRHPQKEEPTSTTAPITASMPNTCRAIISPLISTTTAAATTAILIGNAEAASANEERLETSNERAAKTCRSDE